MSLEQILDYDIIVDQIRTQFFADTNVIEGIAKGDDPQYNELEQAFFDILNNVWLDTAVGIQLDVLGEILDVPRAGKDDASYRTLLELKTRVNRSYGQVNLILDAVKILYQATTALYIPNYPAGFEIQHDGTSGLFLLEDLVTLGTAENIITISGSENIQVRSSDTVAQELIDAIIPAGVEGIITAAP